MPLSPTALHHLRLNTNPPDVTSTMVQSFCQERAKFWPSAVFAEEQPDPTVLAGEWPGNG
jgi:hypothetical protein